MIHQLKIESKYFKKIIEGNKTYEIRKNDRDYHVGDYLGLNEITDHKCNEQGERKETGAFILAKVLDVFSDEQYVKEGYVIMSIRPCNITEADWDLAPYYDEHSFSRPNSEKVI